MKKRHHHYKAIDVRRRIPVTPRDLTAGLDWAAASLRIEHHIPEFASYSWQPGAIVFEWIDTVREAA